MIRLILLFSAAVSPSFESAAWNSAMDRASSCFEQSDYHCALAALQSLDNDDLNDLAKATLLTRLGAVYFRLGDFRTAQTTYIKAIGLWERAAPRDVSRVVSLTSLSTVDHRLGEYSKAEKTARQALDALDQCDANLAETAAAVQNLAAIYQTEGNYSEAERLYRRAAGIVDLSSALSWIAAASAHSNLGRLMGETGRTEEGLREIHEALELWQRGGDRAGEIYGWTNLAIVYIAAKRYREAEDPIRQARDRALELFGPDHPSLETILQTYSTVLNRTGRRREGREMAAAASRIHTLTARSNQLGNTVDAKAFAARR